MYYKKSEPHKASVTGDTVGDPFKDTSGPSMNILIKLMSIVSLVLAPTLAKMYPTKAANVETKQKIEFKVNISKTATSTATANTVEYSTDPKVLIEALTKDNVVNSKEDISIEVNNDKLTVNGKTFTDEQNAKYILLLQKK
jgi:K(+)-stimulated pyrophosphate-energized sodium pump